MRRGAAIAAAGAVTASSAVIAEGEFGDREVAEITEIERELLAAYSRTAAAVDVWVELYPRDPAPPATVAETMATTDAEIESIERLYAFPVATVAELLAKGQAMHRAVDHGFGLSHDEAAPTLYRDIIRVAGGQNV